MMNVKVEYDGGLYELTTISKEKNEVILSDVNSGQPVIMTIDRFISEFYAM